MPDILVSELIAGPEMEVLKDSFNVVVDAELWKSPDRLKHLISDFEAVIVRNQTQINAELIAAGERLKVIGRAGVGLDNIDVQAATAHGVVVVYAPEQNSISVAELTLGLMLSLARMIPEANHSTKTGRWERHPFTGTELYKKTLGIAGLGRIGFRTAMRAKAFGMDVIAYDRYANPDSVTVSEPRIPLVDLDELLNRSDFISCHLPLTPETHRIFSYEAFCQMKPNTFFINTSRGEVVDEEGLIRALQEKKIAGAALDVREKEPPGKNPLVEMRNVILTPHIAAFTQEGQQRVTASVCQDVAAVLRGDGAQNFSNFPKPKIKSHIENTELKEK